MERTRVLKPGSSLSDPSGPNFYDITDLYIGARLQVLSHHFVLLDADEYVFNFMEQDGKRFQYSDNEAITGKIKKLLATLSMEDKTLILEECKKCDKEGLGIIERQDLVKVVKQMFPGILNEHEIITFSRKYEKQPRKPEYFRIVGL